MWNVPRKNISQRNNCLRVLFSNKVTPKFAPSKFDGKISDRWYLYFDHVCSSRSDDVISKFLEETMYRILRTIDPRCICMTTTYWSSISSCWSRKLRIVQSNYMQSKYFRTQFFSSHCINSIPRNKFRQTNIVVATHDRTRTSFGISVNVNEKKYNTVCT